MSPRSASAYESVARLSWKASRTRPSSWAWSTLGDSNIETPEVVAARIRNALKHVPPPERLVAAPDYGMKYLVQGAEMMRVEIL